MKELIYHRHFIPAIKRHKQKLAVVDGDYRASFEQHADRVFRLTHALQLHFGLSCQDRFAVLARNSHAYLELYHAAFLGGGVINPLNLRLSAKELDYIIRDSGAEVIFVDRHFTDMLATARQTSADWPIRKTVIIGEGEAPHDIGYEALLVSAQPHNTRRA